MLNVQYRTVQLEWHNGGVTLNVTLNVIIQTRPRTNKNISLHFLLQEFWQVKRLLAKKRPHYPKCAGFPIKSERNCESSKGYTYTLGLHRIHRLLRSFLMKLIS